MKALPRWCLAALALAACGARADEPLWEAGLGVGALRLPHYRGSDRSRIWILPVPYFIYRGDWLRADRSGARALLLQADRFDFDLSASASPPTNSGDDPARDGMRDLKATFEFGPKLNVKLGSGDVSGVGWKVDLRLPVRGVVTVERHPHAIGWSVAPVLNLDLEFQSWNVGVQAGPLWGSRRLHGYYYDVPVADVTATRPAYDAPGGYAGWQSTIGVSRRFERTWVGAYARADSVAGAAFAPSRLVTSRHQWSAGIAWAWIFAVSDERVPDRR